MPIGKCITHEQANLRKEAAAALGEIADPAAEPFLVLVANDLIPKSEKTRAGRSSRSLPGRRRRVLSALNCGITRGYE